MFILGLFKKLLILILSIFCLSKWILRDTVEQSVQTKLVFSKEFQDLV
jgi:hypothetical protein